jgi:hypothetical protein
VTLEGESVEFSEEKRQEVLDYLEQREGKDFELTQQEIQLEDLDLVKALVAIIQGKTS